MASSTASSRTSVQPRKRSCAATLLGIALAFVILAGVLVAALAFLYFSDWTLPGVHAFDVELGGKTTAEAVVLLRQEWQQQSIVLDDGSQTWTVPPEKLGIILDAEATVRAAHELGRSPSSLDRILAGAGRIRLEPAWNFDRATADAFLRVLAAQVQIPPQNATLRIVSGKVETVPGVPGRRLDVGATLARLEQNPMQVVEDGRLDLATVPLQPTVSDLTAAMADANRIMSGALTMRLYDPVRNEYLEWHTTPAVIGDWLSMRGDPALASDFRWIVDQEKVATYLASQSESLEPERYIDVEEAAPALLEAFNASQPEVRFRVYHHNREHTVQPGETLSSIAFDYGTPYPWIQQANPGTADVLRAGQTITIPSVDVFLPLPPVENKRIVISLEQQRVWVYENGGVKWEWAASTGMDESPTSPGIFQVQTHEEIAYAANWDLHMPSFMGIYQPVPNVDFMNGFHGFPTRGGSQILWTNSLGHRVTYGCILLSSENAKLLYDWAEEGVVVEIHP